MAGASFKMDVSGLMTVFGQAVAHLSDTKVLMEGIGEMLVSSAKERFEKGVEPSGAPWLPSERVKKSGGQTLIKDSHLRKSITHEAGDDYVVVGTPNEKYGAIHQFGGAGAGKPGIPARPYIGVSEDDMEEIGDKVTKFVKGAFKG
jgi:phage virion morphogenesis protein